MIERMFAALMALSACAASAAGSRAPVVWETHPHYVEITRPELTDGMDRMFIPVGQSAEDWTERVHVFDEPVAADSTPASVLAEKGSEQRERCEEFTDVAVDMPVELQTERAMAIWQCARQKGGEHGMAATVTVLVGAGRAYFMISQGSYPAFALSEFPVTGEQSERWLPMHRSFTLCTELTRRGCMPDPTSMIEGESESLSPEMALQVERILDRGRQIYVQDQMAWHATDYVMEHGLIKRRGKGHFVAVPNSTGGGYVYFVRDRFWGKGKARRVAYDVDGRLSTDADEVALDPDIAARLQALRTAKDSKDLRLCGPAVNSVVLPDDEGDGWLVYLMSATTEPHRMLLGGHNRVKISADGRKVLAVDYSANTCLVLETDARGPAGEQVDHLLATHLVSDLPWETHVFQSITFDKSLIVVTADAIWRVKGTTIEKVRLDE